MNAVVGMGPLLALTILAGPVWSDTPDRIHPVPAKEPVYQTKKPKYCLLVFGPEGKTRVWLVRDGDVLYVDRNGSGDLTEKGKRVDILKNLRVWKSGAGFMYTFEAGQADTVRDSGCRITLGWVGWGPVPQVPDYFFFQVAVHGKYEQFHSPVDFAARPQDAPAIPFVGRLTLLFREYLLPNELGVAIGTKGSGKSLGSTLPFAAVPKDIHPVADLEFPNKVPGGKPVRRRIVLNKRC